MHEAGLAQQVIDACALELRARGRRRAVCVDLRIGPAAPIDSEALRFCFDLLKKDTPLCDATLDIEFPATASPDDAAAVEIRYLEFGADTDTAPPTEASEELRGRVKDSTTHGDFHVHRPFNRLPG